MMYDNISYQEVLEDYLGIDPTGRLIDEFHKRLTPVEIERLNSLEEYKFVEHFSKVVVSFSNDVIFPSERLGSQWSQNVETEYVPYQFADDHEVYYDYVRSLSGERIKIDRRTGVRTVQHYQESEKLYDSLNKLPARCVGWHDERVLDPVEPKLRGIEKDKWKCILEAVGYPGIIKHMTWEQRCMFRQDSAERLFHRKSGKIILKPEELIEYLV
jgi:hypothetical protein